MQKDQENQELSFAVKIKIVAIMTLVTIVIIVGAVEYTSYQRNKKQQDAEKIAQMKKLQAAQMANVESLKTVFPSFREIKQFKEKVEMSIVKVNQSELPKTITAGLDESGTNPQCEVPPGPPTSWIITKVSGGTVSSFGSENGWTVAAGGEVGIPADAEYGKYIATYISGEDCDADGTPGVMVYTYTFKIVPPCPTITIHKQ